MLFEKERQQNKNLFHQSVEFEWILCSLVGNCVTFVVRRFRDDPTTNDAVLYYVGSRVRLRLLSLRSPEKVFKNFIWRMDDDRSFFFFFWSFVDFLFVNRSPRVPSHTAAFFHPKFVFAVFFEDCLFFLFCLMTMSFGKCPPIDIKLSA